MQLQPIVVGPDPGIGLPSGWLVTLMDAEDNVAVIILRKAVSSGSEDWVCFNSEALCF